MLSGDEKEKQLRRPLSHLWTGVVLSRVCEAMYQSNVSTLHIHTRWTLGSGVSSEKERRIRQGGVCVYGLKIKEAKCYKATMKRKGCEGNSLRVRIARIRRRDWNENSEESARRGGTHLFSARCCGDFKFGGSGNALRRRLPADTGESMLENIILFLFFITYKKSLTVMWLPRQRSS